MKYIVSPKYKKSVRYETTYGNPPISNGVQW